MLRCILAHLPEQTAVQASSYNRTFCDRTPDGDNICSTVQRVWRGAAATAAAAAALFHWGAWLKLICCHTGCSHVIII
jgi:uncharacterized protein (UPF0548 family)